MSTAVEPSFETLADLLEWLGDVPLQRIRLRPPLGTATEQDVLEIAAREGRACELIDGVLVERPVGHEESILAIFIARMLGSFVGPRNLGHVTGEQGMVSQSWAISDLSMFLSALRKRVAMKGCQCWVAMVPKG